jgi:hypothetical protein
MCAVTTEKRRLEQALSGAFAVESIGGVDRRVAIPCANALREEQSLDAIDMAGALPNQPLAFLMGAARVLLLDAW